MKSSELKRFHNPFTNQILRVLPLFERFNHESESKNIIGVCMDSDLSYKNIKYGDPIICKGEIVLLIKNRNSRIKKTYKGEPLLDFIKVIDDYSSFVKDNYITHYTRTYRSGKWENYR